MKKIAELVREHAELSIFFFFLTTSLFLGDGKQPFVDVWWALGILTMYGVRYYQRGKFDLSPPPHPTGFVWTAIIVYYIVLIPFSDSAGYSITATVRLIEAYLVYTMFITVSSERVIVLFTKGLIFVGVVAILTSFVFLLVPSWTSFLPPMNLLYAAYGHNHLADLLLFMIPITIGIVEQKKSVVTIGLLVLFFVGMALTLARGAWIVLIGYLLFVFLKKKDVRTRVIALVGAAALVVAPLLLSVVSVNKTAAGMFQKVPQLSRLLQKNSLLEDGRWEYWRQAVEAIKERPLFGSGPGTFYLESKRLQARPNFYSWFAHSFLLETMVEVGAVGAMLLSLVFIASLRRVHTSPLFAPLLLTLLYSFFEFNLNYVSVWLFFWAAIGLSFNDKKNNHQRHQGSRGLVVGGIAVLCVFYATYVSSVALDVVGNKKLAFYTAPYMVSTTKNYLEQLTRDNKKFLSREEYIILRIFKKDPEVLMLFAQGLDRQADAINIYYEKGLLLDPYNLDYKKKRFVFLVNNRLVDAIGKQVKQWGDTFLVGEPQREALKIDFSSPIFAEGYKTIFSNEAYQQPRTPEELSVLYYQLGLSVLSREPQRTLDLWTLARDSAPQWGYYHAEIASLLLYIFQDESKAKKVLMDCQVYQFPAELCRVTLYYWGEVPKPGSFEKEIQEIIKTREQT